MKNETLIEIERALELIEEDYLTPTERTWMDEVFYVAYGTLDWSEADEEWTGENLEALDLKKLRRLVEKTEERYYRAYYRRCPTPSSRMADLTGGGE